MVYNSKIKDYLSNFKNTQNMEINLIVKPYIEYILGCANNTEFHK